MRLFPTSSRLLGVIRSRNFFGYYRNTCRTVSSLQSSPPLGSSFHLEENAKPLHSTVRPASRGSSITSELTMRATSQPQQPLAKMPTTASLPWHVNLIGKILSSKTEPFKVKRKRITGVVQKLETHHLEWLEEVAMDPNLPDHCFSLLQCLAKALPFFGDVRQGRRKGHLHTPDEELEWSGVSPYFSEGLSDTLCVCLRRAVQTHSTAAELTMLLRCAVELELADSDSLNYITHKLSCRDHCIGTTASDIVEVLWLLSLAVKRCKLSPPPLNHLLCRLLVTKLTLRESLHVFSALVRFKDRSANEVFEVLTRRAVSDVGAYTAQDIIFVLQAIALLNNSSADFAGVVIERCAELVPKMSPKEVGDVAKYLALLHPGRRYNSIAETCAKELRRTLPVVANRAEELLGSFTLSDARNILKCLSIHKVRHAILFSRLIPMVSDD